MTTDEMPKPDPGVHRRTRSANWHWRIKAPTDLRTQYVTEWAHRVSLRTSNVREANHSAAQLRAHWLERFVEQRRELHPQRIDLVTPELAAILAQRVTAATLAQDDKLRSDPALAALLINAVRGALPPSGLFIGDGPPLLPLAVPSDPLEGLTEELAAALAKLNAGMSMQGAVMMATQRIAGVLPMAQAEARKLGLSFDKNTPGALEALRGCLRAYRTALQQVAERDLGEVIETPAPPTQRQAQAAKPISLRGVYDRWKLSKVRGPDALAACLRALTMFEVQSGNPPVLQITRSDGDAFRAWLIAQPGSSKTKHDRITWVKTLLGYASRDLELIPRQPWEGIDIEHHTETRRGAWTPAQLKAFFGMPLFEQYALPSSSRAGADAAYWVPLLGLYTGATVSELAQLRVADLFADEAGPVLRITDEGAGQQTKNPGARVRTVPLHPELVRLGLLDYVRAIEATKADRLWPALRLRKGKAGDNFSRWFRDARALASIPVPDFHSLRHTVRTAMTEAGVMDASLKDRITGHRVKGSDGTVTYDHPKKAVRAAVEAIHYPSIKLPRVFGSFKRQ